jgi:hypothetical protein
LRATGTEACGSCWAGAAALGAAAAAGGTGAAAAGGAAARCTVFEDPPAAAFLPTGLAFGLHGFSLARAPDGVSRGIQHVQSGEYTAACAQSMLSATFGKESKKQRNALT